jgi:hypothetical protein
MNTRNNVPPSDVPPEEVAARTMISREKISVSLFRIAKYFELVSDDPEYVQGGGAVLKGRREAELRRAERVRHDCELAAREFTLIEGGTANADA